MTKPLDPNGLMGVTAAAKVLRVSRSRVHQMITEGKLPATLVGISYALRRADVIELKDRPGPGAPPKHRS